MYSSMDQPDLYNLIVYPYGLNKHEWPGYRIPTSPQVTKVYLVKLKVTFFLSL